MHLTTHPARSTSSATAIILRDDRCSSEFIVLRSFMEDGGRVVLGNTVAKRDNDYGFQLNPMVLTRTCLQGSGKWPNGSHYS